jgi:hypothetical protein
MAVVLAGLLVTPAFAENWRGRGSIHCEGSGVIYLRGNGEVELTARVGALGFKDLGGDGEITVEGTGRKVHLPGGATVWLGFGGSASASGSRIVVGVRGRDIVLDAHGQGLVRARGVGFCRVGDAELAWTDQIQGFDLAPQD